ncbi:hypothetical protein ASPVEDRAFT_580018 [Aspergillus versicolor CBS 583.65]|uniref:Uncharacterized protein n=1 Tax=Aspergillus versicolor CBS 583.65 TaxID=1036611 RepID=A0A1L9PGD2_ASPVE|nr:uncharacterized protein ASPVEDRAFT_580018 [Aspergillus versicolor CBS 583.65]OJJ00584.1 hypothetical protein ASPVEDRAFT_580018 [Aspergillus versicolor CBS 583.65]
MIALLVAYCTIMFVERGVSSIQLFTGISLAVAGGHSSLVSLAPRRLYPWDPREETVQWIPTNEAFPREKGEAQPGYSLPCRQAAALAFCRTTEQSALGGKLFHKLQ